MRNSGRNMRAMKPSSQKCIKVFVYDPIATPRPHKGRPDALQNEEIGNTDGEKKQRRDQRSYYSSHIMESIEFTLKSCRRRGNRDRGKHHNGGMAERKKEPDGKWRLAFLHQLSDDIVDSSDMVGVEGMPKAEHVSQKGGAQEGRPIRKSDPCPKPCCCIRRSQERVGRSHLGLYPGRLVVK
jgi:hypothetical protein